MIQWSLQDPSHTSVFLQRKVQFASYKFEKLILIWKKTVFFWYILVNKITSFACLLDSGCEMWGRKNILFVSTWYETKAKVFICGSFFSNGVHTFTALMVLCIFSLGLQYLYGEYTQLYDPQINSSKHGQKFSGYLNATKWMHLKKQLVSVLWILGHLFQCLVQRQQPWQYTFTELWVIL